MGDEDRLKELITRYGAQMGYAAETVMQTFYTGRLLMRHVGSFEGLCQAELSQIQAWFDAIPYGSTTACSHRARIRRVYDILVLEGLICENPAKDLITPRVTKDDCYRKPPLDLADVRMLLDEGKRISHTIRGAKTYAILCLRVRCGVRYTVMAKCRMSDLELDGYTGKLLGYNAMSGRENIFWIDEETVYALKNYMKLRGGFSESEPLILKSPKCRARKNEFCSPSSICTNVSRLCGRKGIRMCDYDLSKTVALLACSEGASIMQATSIAANESMTFALRVIEEFGDENIGEVKRRLLGKIDSSAPIATGLIKSETLIDAVSVAYRTANLKVIIGPDGWATLELPRPGER